MTVKPIYPIYFFDQAVRHFEKFLDGVDVERFLQIGVLTGDVTLWMAERYPNALLTDVDPWTIGVYDDHYTSGDIEPALAMDYDAIHDYYVKRTAHLGIRLVTYRETSAEFFTHCTTEYDTIYIDGDHSRKACYDDLEGALLVSHVGTVIAVDDYNFPEVKAAVDEFVAQGDVDVCDPIIADHEPEVLDPSTTKAMTFPAEQWQQWLVVR
jgi:predicted O-methyltransferase YrrM